MTIFENAMSYMTEGVAWDAAIKMYNELGSKFIKQMKLGAYFWDNQKFKQALDAYNDAKKMIPDIRKEIEKIADDDKDDIKKQRENLSKDKKNPKYKDITKNKRTYTRNYNLRWLEINEGIVDRYIANLEMILK